MADQIESYTLKTLLSRGRRDLMMDFRGSVNETFLCEPSHVSDVVDELDSSYEGAYPDSWTLEYQQDGELVLFSAEKQYDEIAEFAEESEVVVNPPYWDSEADIYLDPVKNRGLEVELRGMLDMTSDQIYFLLD